MKMTGLPADKLHILILAGTENARALITRLKAEYPDIKITASLAGETKNPIALEAPTRIGGFGGVQGLVRYIQDNDLDLIIDATHPFAEQISRHAAAAAKECSCPLIALKREFWHPEEGDNWQSTASAREACDRLPSGTRVFVALGRRALADFAHRGDIWCLFRMVDRPKILPALHGELICARPTGRIEDEITLMREHAITHLVCRNSGGIAGKAKIDAARALHMPVLMISRTSPDPTHCPGGIKYQLTASQIIGYLSKMVQLA